MAFTLNAAVANDSCEKAESRKIIIIQTIISIHARIKAYLGNIIGLWKEIKQTASFL